MPMSKWLFEISMFFLIHIKKRGLFQTNKNFKYTIDPLDLKSQNYIEKLLSVGITLHKTKALFKKPLFSKLSDKLWLQLPKLYYTIG